MSSKTPLSLFEQAADREQVGAPLADRMRPTALEEVVGQQHLLGREKLLAASIATDQIPSMILWGPPGSGKTTIARVVAGSTHRRFRGLSAVLAGVAELREIISEARERLAMERKQTILFLDEIHRFNKAQQDALLPHVEKGTVTLIGATTDNPSFSVNAALLSRCVVLKLEPLGVEDIASLLLRALGDDARGLGACGLGLTETARDAIAKRSEGDARRALTALELAAHRAQGRGSTEIDDSDVEQALQHDTLLYDRDGEEHYNLASAFIKSLRGSDPDAAVYWMMRMVDAGEDPRFLVRRMIIFASEDIGNADPRALQTAVAADDAFTRIGMPEGIYALTQAATFLAVAPKSNASLRAIAASRRDIKAHGALPVPMKLRNAPTDLMRSFGYGAGYDSPHDHPEAFAPTTYLPEALEGSIYYSPTRNGLEAKISDRLSELRKRTRSGGS